MDISIHRVTKIEFSRRFTSNGNCRSLLITDIDGRKMEITLYGDTDALEALPHSDGFRDFDAKQALENEAAA